MNELTNGQLNLKNILKKYIRKFQFNSVIPDDFFNEFTSLIKINHKIISNLNTTLCLSDILLEQLETKGFPLFTVKVLDKKIIIN